MNVLDLFSGIGGFSLGLERAGMRTVAFCEIEAYPRAVLKKHWPNVPCYTDVRELTADRLRADGIVPNVICGGFPCQDISFAGSGAGIEGERSGLWIEYARLIGEVRPVYVIVENVAALLGRGLDVVLGDLAALGYDAEWYCIPASALGAPHRRDRIWIVAYPNAGFHARALVGGGLRDPTAGGQSRDPSKGEASHWERLRIEPGAGGEALADAAIVGRLARREGYATQEQRGRQPDRGGISPHDVADTNHPRLQGWLSRSLRECAREWTARTSSPSGADADSEPPIGASISWRERSHWFVEPDVGRVANGVSARVDRLKCLGNAVVPQIPEIIGRAIMKASQLSSQDRGAA